MKRTSVNLKFPNQFAKFINNIKQAEFDGESMHDFLKYLDKEYGEVSSRILEKDGKVKPYINLYIGKKNINSLDGLDTKIPAGESISLLLSRAGG